MKSLPIIVTKYGIQCVTIAFISFTAIGLAGLIGYAAYALSGYSFWLSKP